MSFDKFLNRSGISVIEVLMAMGLMGVVVAISATVMTNNTAMFNSLEFKQDVYGIVYDLQSRLMDPTLCKAAMGLDANPIKLTAAAKKSSLDASAVGMPVAFTLANGEEIKSKEVLKNYAVEIQRLEFFDESTISSSTKSVSLVGYFAPKKKAIGAQLVRRQIATLNVTTNASNQITGCSGTGSSGATAGRVYTCTKQNGNCCNNVTYLGATFKDPGEEIGPGKLIGCFQAGQVCDSSGGINGSSGGGCSDVYHCVCQVE